jgi:hypothetical protein
MDEHGFLFGKNGFGGVAKYAGTAIPLLLVLFSIAYSAIDAVGASLDGILKFSADSAIFVCLVLIMYVTVYGDQYAKTKESSEEYKAADSAFAKARAIAVTHEYTEIDAWLLELAMHDAEVTRQQIVIPFMKWETWLAEYKGKTVRELRKLPIAKDVKSALIRAAKVRPHFTKRSDLLSCTADASEKTATTIAGVRAREIWASARSLMPRLIFTWMSVKVVFEFSTNPQAAILPMILEVTSLLSTAYSALQNARHAVCVTETSYITWKTELLEKFECK